MYDVAIVGAGPAGSNLARLIAERYKVLLIDKRDLDNEHPQRSKSKCCGGLLAPDAQKMIAKLQLGIPRDILVDPQLFAVRTIDLTNHLERLYQRFYLNMDRDKFDRWLVSILPAGVEKSFNSLFRSFAATPGGYEIRYLTNGREAQAKARIIVGADGAFSRVRSLIGTDVQTPQRYIAIQEWFECPDHIPYFTAIFDETISDFYSWMIPKENCLLLGSALRPGEDARKKYEMLKRKLAQMGFRLDASIKTEGAHICRPMKPSHFYAGRDRIALVGEAAGAISPSSAEGISYALKSSLHLAQSMEVGLDGFLDRYQQRTADIRFNLLMKNLKSPAMYNPFLRQLTMRSGVQSI
jgi:flavin-dependent dehydrogenase